MQAYERLQKARLTTRPTALAMIGEVFDSFLEFHGDRLYGDDSAVIGGIGMLDGRPVTVIGTQKGEGTEQRVKRNFGSAHPEGYRKALRLMRQAEKFRRPVVCIVDTSGAYCGIGAEERGQGAAIAENLMALSRLETPVIAIILGEGGSGGALALAVADRVWMLENAVYSVISPEGAASILYKDAALAPKACGELKMTADDLLGFGVIERIFPEYDGDFAASFAQIKAALIKELDGLSRMPAEELQILRYEKFRAIGRGQ